MGFPFYVSPEYDAVFLFLPGDRIVDKEKMARLVLVYEDGIPVIVTDRTAFYDSGIIEQTGYVAVLMEPPSVGGEVACVFVGVEKIG